MEQKTKEKNADIFFINAILKYQFRDRYIRLIRDIFSNK